LLREIFVIFLFLFIFKKDRILLRAKGMSGFEDSEYDEAITTALADISFEDHVKYILRPPQQRHSVLLNTNFTPVRDSSPMPINTHSGMTSPAPSNEGGRRGSVRRSSIHGAPSDELLSTTAARMNDKAALEEKSRARSPSYLHVQELPQNSHLLSTTVSRVFEQNALEEQRTRKGSPQRGFKIATEDFQVSNSLLRPTESRKAELRAIEEAKKPASPNYKIPPPDFVPNSRLLKMTKERESDRLVLEEKKNGPKKVPGNGKKTFQGLYSWRSFGETYASYHFLSKPARQRKGRQAQCEGYLVGRTSACRESEIASEYSIQITITYKGIFECQA
jgi:hypothetical protein